MYCYSLFFTFFFFQVDEPTEVYHLGRKTKVEHKHEEEHTKTQMQPSKADTRNEKEGKKAQ